MVNGMEYNEKRVAMEEKKKFMNKKNAYGNSDGINSSGNTRQSAKAKD